MQSWPLPPHRVCCHPVTKFDLSRPDFVKMVWKMKESLASLQAKRAKYDIDGVIVVCSRARGGFARLILSILMKDRSKIDSILTIELSPEYRRVLQRVVSATSVISLPRERITHPLLSRPALPVASGQPSPIASRQPSPIAKTTQVAKKRAASYDSLDFDVTKKTMVSPKPAVPLQPTVTHRHPSPAPVVCEPAVTHRHPSPAPVVREPAVTHRLPSPTPVVREPAVADPHVMQLGDHLILLYSLFLALYLSLSFISSFSE